MSDFEFREENTIEAVFSMEVGREMNDHSKLYNRYADDQHPISAITGLTEALAGQTSDLQAETSRAEAAEQALDNKIEAETTRAEGAESGLNTAISNETTARIQADTTLQSNITAEENRAKGIENGLRSDLTAETTARENADTGLQGQITTNANDIDSIEDKIPSEASSSNQLADKSYVDTADNDLQSQIDAITAASDVTDIVGTYAELQAYDTSKLTDGDVIKVLHDESQDDAITYYRWVITGGTGSFNLIGSEGPYYTVAETDTLLGAKQNTIDSTHKLDSDLVDDNGQTNKFVTASEKAQITTNANNITELQTNKADKSTTYTKTEVDTIASGKANVGLDNLNANGQMVIDSVDGKISNCILEIPQNLKLEISGSNVIVKAGSIGVRPGSTYQTYTFTDDYSYDYSTNSDGTYFFMVRVFSGGPANIGQPINETVSGATDSLAGTGYHTWFDTTNLQIKRYGSDPNNPDTASMYPFAIINVENGVPSFAKDSKGRDMIFNGVCYVGHHAVFYPDHGALCPNGWTDKGKLNSYLRVNNAVRIVELNHNYSNIALGSQSAYYTQRVFGEDLDNISDLSDNGIWHYIRLENAYYEISGGNPISAVMTNVLNYTYDGTTVTKFDIRQPVRLATTEMLDKVQSQVDTNTSDIANKQDTLVSGTNIKTINSTSVLGSGNFTLADQSLSNLDSTGQMVVDSQNGTISKCVLEIPQNIKCSIANNVVTLDAGSILTNTGSSYSTTTLTSAQTYTIDSSLADGNYLLCSNGTAIQYPLGLTVTSSGASNPADGSTYTYFFNTTDKVINKYDSGWSDSGYCYPFAEITMTSGVASFTKDDDGYDTIFNGCCFVGRTRIIFPFVKVLQPNYKDNNGKLVSKEVVTASLIVNSNVGSSRDALFISGVNSSSVVPSSSRYYNKEKNMYYNSDNVPVLLCLLAKTKGDVENMTIMRPYEDCRDLTTDNKQDLLTTMTGYDSTQTQTLKNINGVLQWVTD